MHCIRGALLVLVMLAGAAGALAQGACTPDREGKMVCPAPDSTCVVNRTGDVICSTPGGGIEFDRYGEPVCGAGYCTKDLRGDLFCSSSPRGASATDRYGAANCSVSCVPAVATACVKAVPAR